MIVRAWKGRTSAANADAYERHVRHSVFPALREISGYAGARLLRRDEGEDVEFLVLTEWTSWDAIHAFAGEDPSAAVIEPAARAVLAHADERVVHYELIVTDAVQTRSGA
jgi:heme-degrading monooxygenase HmoA